MKRSKKKSVLEKLSASDIEEITKRAEKSGNVALVSTKQVNMRLSSEILSQARKLAEAQGKPVTTFLASLLKEDITRLWSVFKD